MFKIKTAGMLFLFFYISVSMQAQYLPNGYYQNENNNAYCLVNNDTVIHTSYKFGFYPSGIELLRVLKKNKLQVINPKVILRSNFVVDSISKNESKKAFFKVFDFSGREFSDTIICSFSYVDGQKQRKYERVHLGKKNGYYTYDYEAFHKGSLSIFYFKDWFFNVEDCSDCEDLRGFISSNGASYFRIFLAPSISYPIGDKYKGRKMKYKYNNEKLMIYFPRGRERSYSKNIETFRKVEPDTWNSVIKMIFDSLAGIKEQGNNSFKVLPFEEKNLPRFGPLEQ
jgi:hypothetical protein